MTSSTVAFAQGGRGMRTGSAISGLLNMPEVQNELKLEGDVLEKVKKFAEESQAKLREEIQMVRDQGLSEEETRKESIAVAEQFLAKDTAALEKLISADQMKRFKQLMIQRQGVSAVTRKEVAEAIGLKEEDRAKLKTTVDELNQASMAKMQELFQSGDRDQAQKVMTDSRKKVEDTILAALSEDQKAKFTELKGAEFKFPEPQRGGGRRDF